MTSEADHRMIEPMSAPSDSPLRPDDRPGGLTPLQEQWARRSEDLWRRAHAIVRRHPDADVSDLYHALRCLQLTPSQRLAAGLRRGRLRAHTR